MSDTGRSLVRCPSCDGYGWLDDEDGGDETCGWCNGAGYVIRDARGVDTIIPTAEYEALAGQLEALERQRLAELGYSGGPKKPWEQAIRRDRNDGLAQRGAPGQA